LEAQQEEIDDIIIVSQDAIACIVFKGIEMKFVNLYCFDLSKKLFHWLFNFLTFIFQNLKLISW
jgi:hypothetical protein